MLVKFILSESVKDILLYSLLGFSLLYVFSIIYLTQELTIIDEISAISISICAMLLGIRFILKYTIYSDKKADSKEEG